MGVCKQRAAHGYQVRLSFPDDAIGKLRCSYSADRNDGDIYLCFDGFGQMYENPFFNVIGRMVQVA